jgi:hypothetical protein
MKTNHVNYVDNSGRVYCYKVNRIVDYGKPFFDRFCMVCPYFVDTANMMGVECAFDDKCSQPSVVFDDSAESERHSRMVEVRLGLKTEAEVDRTLQGFGAENEKHLEVSNPTVEEVLEKEKKVNA